MTMRKYLLVTALAVSAVSATAAVVPGIAWGSTKPASQAAKDKALAAKAYSGLQATLALHKTTAKHPTKTIPTCRVSHTPLTLARQGMAAAHITSVHAGKRVDQISRWGSGKNSGLALGCFLGGAHQVALAAVTHNATITKTYLKGWSYVTTSHGGKIYDTFGDKTLTTCNATWVAPNKRYVLSLQFYNKNKTTSAQCGASLKRIEYSMEKTLAAYAPKPHKKH
jgi:hypothetical protein